MRKIDILCGLTAFIIIVLIFGVVGGVDCGRLSLGRSFIYIAELSLALVADVKIHDSFDGKGG